ncbi:hypothetical protein L4X63_02570 [Geomonas sp. Red32]|uniref:hypothetical protein n=1 Tax=Geomonas sp. Red32 TaxID=2912856 RepID=UPI00202CC0A8|nr:hypothetical protein [Geomonas sp. Red32]MCM0080465.1 hypothetical protein [Geomonas sp. Red32]
MLKQAKIVILAMAVVLMATAAFAAPKVEIKIRAEKAKITVAKDGTKSTKMVLAKNFAPGEVIHYIVLYRNTGSEDATNAVISDPIPQGTVYIPGSASETGEVSFSIDGGKSFNRPALLTYQTRGEKRVASPEEYTNIRWVINRIPAGAQGKVSFQVKVK